MMHCPRRHAIPMLAGALVALAGASTASAQYTVGDQWLRAVDFQPGDTHGSVSGNPGPGFDGMPVWKYEIAHGGGGLGSGNEWFRQPTTMMTWDSEWWDIGEGAWSLGDDANPPVFRDRMTHNYMRWNYENVPLVRWMNPGGDDMRVSVTGDYNVLWSGHQLVGGEMDVELVIAREDASTGEIDVLFSETVSKPTAGLSMGDNVDVPVDLSMITLGADDSLIFSGRAVDSVTGLGRWVAISDQLTIEVVPIPSAGALGLFGIAGLGAVRRRRS
ncbi:MAG: hypothetical protein ACF8R7_13570 [Phycisphaerales bacterium JB039]